MDLYSFLEPLARRMEETLSLVELALSEGDEIEASKIMMDAKKIDMARKDVLNAMRHKRGDKLLSEETKRLLETMGKEPDIKLNYREELDRAGLSNKFIDNTRSATKMFDKLLKLANDLDAAGHYDEASAVDDVLKSLAMGDDLVNPPVPVPAEPMSELEKMKMEMELLKKQNEVLLAKQKTMSSGGIKVSEKGGVSVYGIGRFPVTLYKSQWERLLGKKDDILKFIADNAALLKVKEE